MPKVEISGVSQVFWSQSGAIQALGETSLSIEEGEFVCIVGPSGCGKSTLLNLVAGLTKPDSGQVKANGALVTGPGPDRVVMFQESGLFPWLNVLQNVMFGLKMARVAEPERRERAEKLLQMVHLSRFTQAWVHELSGGMKQRVALARALAPNPDILLMDEPFAALDAQTRDMLHDELEDLWASTRKTIIFVTHNVREAVRLGTRVIVMTARPGQVKNIYDIDLPRPRHIEDVALATIAATIRDDLRNEVLQATHEEGID